MTIPNSWMGYFMDNPNLKWIWGCPYSRKPPYVEKTRIGWLVPNS